MGVGRGQGSWLLVNFENFSKKTLFLSFEWENRNFTIFGPPEKCWKNPLVSPPGKILPTPMSADFQRRVLLFKEANCHGL